MLRIKKCRVLALTVALVFLFTSVAFAAVPKPQYVYFQSGNDMVKVDYAEAVDDAMNDDNTLYDAVKQYVGAAELGGTPVVVETDTGSVIDYQKVLGEGKRIAEVVDDPAYATAKPEPNKELRVENGQAVIGDIAPVLEVISVTAIDATTIEVSFSDGTTATITDFTPSPLVDGTNTVTFEYEGQTFTVNVDYTAPDTEAPVITIGGVNDGQFYNSAVTPVITVDDEVATVAMTLDGAEYDGSEIAAEGAHELVVTATDAAGNEATQIVRFTIDLTVPVITVAAATVDVTADQQKLTFTVEDANVSAEDITVAQAGQTLAVTAEEAANTYSVLLNEVQGANQTLTIDVTDKAGNAAEQVSVTLVDKKAPEIVSVENVNGNQLVVVFSEAVNETAAVEPANYLLRNVATGQQYNLDDGDADGTIDNDGEVDPVAALSADKRTVTITLTAELTDKLGVAGLNTLDSVEYRLFVNPGAAAASNIFDLAPTPNRLVNNSYQSFPGVIASDTTAPALQAAAYDTGLGKLDLTFNEPTIVADITKFSIVNGGTVVSLTAQDTVADNDTTVTITLSADHVAALGELQTGAYVSIAAGGVRDNNQNLNAAALQAPIAATVRPAIAGGTYDETSNKLMVNFTKAIRSATVDVAKIKVQYSTDGSAYNDLVTLNPSNFTINRASALTTELVFDLDQTAIDDIGAQRNVAVAYRIGLRDEAVEDANGLKNDVAGTDAWQFAALTYIKDTVAPAIESAKYYTDTDASLGVEAGHLYIKFDQTLRNVLNDDSDGILNSGAIKIDGLLVLKYGETEVVITDNTAPEVDAPATLMADGRTFDVALNIVSGSAIENALKAGTLLVVAKQGIDLQDVNGNKVAAAGNVSQAVIYVDNRTPVSVSGTASPQQIKLTQSPTDFGGTVTAANFTVFNAANVNDVKEIERVDMLDTNNDGTKDAIFIALKSSLTAGVQVKVAYSGLVDALGNAITDGTTDAISVVADSTAPNLAANNGAVYVDNGDNAKSAGDKIVLTFNEPVKLIATPSLPAYYGTGASIALGEAANQVVITVGTGDSIDFDTNKLEDDTHKNNITDRAENPVDLSSIRIPMPAEAAGAEIVSAVFADANQSGAVDAVDTLTVKFSQNIAGSTLANIDENDFIVTTATLDIDPSKTVLSGTDTLVFTLGEGVSGLEPGTDTIDVAASNDIVNTWGIKAAQLTTDVTITSEDTSNPSITSVTLTDQGSEAVDAGDVLIVTFTEPVHLVTGLTSDVFNISVTNIVYGDQIKQITPTQVAFVMQGPEDITVNTTAIDVQGFGTSKIADAAGNKTVPSSPKTVTAKALAATPSGFVVTDNESSTADTLAVAGVKPGSTVAVFSDDGVFKDADVADDTGEVAALTLDDNSTAGTYTYVVIYVDANGALQISTVSYTASN